MRNSVFGNSKLLMEMFMNIPKDFKGFAGEPESELETIFLFGLFYNYLNLPFVVRKINDGFPDCEAIDLASGKTIYIEFEVLSYNYFLYGHPIDGCDYIVCWRNNWPESPIKIIALEEEAKS